MISSFLTGEDRLADDPFNCWHLMVDYYSGRQLTFDTDKLPAISGLASKVYELTKSPYAAGLWSKNLPADLMWRSLRPKGSREYASANSTPSWSWASVKGHVDFASSSTRTGGLYTISEYLTRVLDVQCDVPGLNPFGEFSGGSFTLRGPFSTSQLVYNQARLRREEEKYWLDGEGGVSKDIAIQADSYLEASIVRAADNLLNSQYEGHFILDRRSTKTLMRQYSFS